MQKVEKWQRESLPEEYKANGVPDFRECRVYETTR